MRLAPVPVLSNPPSTRPSRFDRIFFVFPWPSLGFPVFVPWPAIHLVAFFPPGPILTSLLLFLFSHCKTHPSSTLDPAFWHRASTWLLVLGPIAATYSLPHGQGSPVRHFFSRLLLLYSSRDIANTRQQTHAPKHTLSLSRYISRVDILHDHAHAATASPSPTARAHRRC